MKVFVVEPRITMTKVDLADQFNNEVMNQFMDYGIEYYSVNDKNMGIIKPKITKDSTTLQLFKRNAV